MTDSDKDSPSQHEEGFISRWSRRKHVAKTATDDKSLKEPLEDSQDAALIAEETAEEAFEAAVVEDDFPVDSDMPPLESLGNDSDYSGFMSPKVSDELRNLALRKLFLGGMFNIRDGLDDYDDDFTSFEKLGDIVTADMRHQMAMAKEALEASQASEELNEEDADKAPERTIESASADSEMTSDAEMEAGALIVAAEQDDDDISAVNHRRADDNETHVEDSNVKQDK